MLTFEYAWNGFVGVGAESQSEDCLTLNVWAPNPDRGRSLPVLFWIHGGGFGSGSPAFVNTDGMALAGRGDVVVVSVTHRLNVFGHLFLGGIAGDEYRDSSNVGHLDIVLALEWVRANIGQFGGNPAQVTLFGQSGGSAKIGCLMAMPSAGGLFNGAVMQSGVRTVGPTIEQADDFARRLLRQLELSDQEWPRLLELPPERLLRAAAEVDTVSHRDFIEPGPVVDGSALPSAPIDAIRGGSAKQVRLMIGTCVDEMELTWRNPPAVATRTGTSRPLAGRSGLGEVKRLLGEYGDAIAASYIRAAPGAAEEETAKLLTADWKHRIPSIRFAEAQVAAGQGDVYMYLFGWRSSVMPDARAAHSIDIPFWFGNTTKVSVTASDPSSGALALQITDALVAFAGTGKPRSARQLAWPAYEPSRRATMILDRECRIEEDPDGRNRLAWEAVPTSRIGI